MKIGINGFGRIGRAILRINYIQSEFEIVAVNDIDPNIDNHAYLLKYDTQYGRFKGKVRSDAKNNHLIVDGQNIHFFSEENIDQVPWDNYDVDVVLDSSGIYSNVIHGKQLLESSRVKHIVVTHSPKDGVDKTVIFGVNDDEIDIGKHKIFSTSICDSNASGPVLHHLEREYGISHGFITTLHPWLSYQNLVDGSLRSVSSPGHFWNDFALGRASTESLIPKSTTLIGALAKVMPETAMKLDAMSFRVPTGIVSSSDLTITLKKEISAKEINDLFLAISMKDGSYLGYQEDQTVSIDFKGIHKSCFVDGRWTRVINGDTLKLILWYDNEWGYSNRVYDMAKFLKGNL